MLSLEQALKIAEQELESPGRSLTKGGSVIVQEATTITPHVYVFCYNSREYYETGNMEAMYGGNAPIFVSRSDGRVWYYGTSLEVEEQIEVYEEQHQIWELRLNMADGLSIPQCSVLREVMGWSMKELSDFKKAMGTGLTWGGAKRLKGLQESLYEHLICTLIKG